MPNLDLGNAQDFATATLSGASSVLNQIAGQNSGKWAIEEASYGVTPQTAVKFHIFKSKADYDGAVPQIQDRISRRIPEFKFPYMDGQTTEDLGQEGGAYEFDVILHGPNYYAAYIALLKECNKSQPGTLIHPVNGPLTVKFKNATITHKSQERQAVTLHMVFVDHTFDVSFSNPVPTVKSTLANAVAFIAQINNAVTRVQSNLLTASIVTNAITGAISSFGASFQTLLVALNTSFNAGSSADIPSLLPVTQGDTAAFPTGVTSNDAFAGLTPAQIQQQQTPVVSPAQATSLVADLWTQANDTIAQLEAANGGQGALIFYDQTQTIRQAAIAAKQALNLCLQSSKSTVVNYITPRLMSIREICFANGLDPDSSEDVLTLNPSLLSANYIDAGTTVLVPGT